MWQNPTDLKSLLVSARTIAVVGLSDQPARDSYRVARYMQQHGYRIIPVNPNLTAELLGEQVYPDLASVPGPIDMVNVFRRPEALPDVVAAAIAAQANILWTQLGVVHEAALSQAREAGLTVVADKCLMVEHRRLFSLARG